MNTSSVDKNVIGSKPLLSICVPTYNRAHLLKIMLQAALPQVKELSDLVELCISDNASPDNTAEVVEQARKLGPLNYARNASNLGGTFNFVSVATRLARGEYVWLIGDDDLLNKDAVARVVGTLAANRQFDAFYSNFQVASFEGDWPDSAVGGYSGNSNWLHNPNVADCVHPKWKELIRAKGGLCGNVYGNIIRREVWVDYWKTRRIPSASSRTLFAWYPHTCMFADTLLERPAYYIGQPVLTTFEGSQTFIKEYSNVYAFLLPRVLRYYHRRGFNGPMLHECAQQLFFDTGRHLTELLKSRSTTPSLVVLSFMRAGWRYKPAWKVLACAVRVADRPFLASKLIWALLKVKRGLRVVSGLRAREPN